MILSILLALASPQTPPVFEVAAIKTSNSPRPGYSWNTTKGEVVMKNIPLKECVKIAYGLRDYSYSGPVWLETTRFDITAKPPAGWIERRDLGPMMKVLLADRFKLAVHTEQKSVAGFALTQAKGGLKIKTAEAEDGTHSQGNALSVHFNTKGITMADFALYLSRQINAPVEDKTGAAGRYAFEFEFGRENAAPDADNPIPSVFVVLQSQLGLNLAPQKMPVDVIVVDRMERVPTEN